MSTEEARKKKKSNREQFKGNMTSLPSHASAGGGTNKNLLTHDWPGIISNYRNWKNLFVQSYFEKEIKHGNMGSELAVKNWNLLTGFQLIFIASVKHWYNMENMACFSIVCNVANVTREHTVSTYGEIKKSNPSVVPGTSKHAQLGTRCTYFWMRRYADV